MRNEPGRRDWLRRLTDWAEEAPDLSQEMEEDPERPRFLAYLQYLESHPYLDYEAYCRGEGGPLPGGGGAGHEPQAVPRRLSGRRRPSGGTGGMFRLYRALSMGVTAVMMAALVWVSLSLPAFGDPEAPAMNEVSRRYVEQGVEETGAVNLVAGLILDYRAFDTFGESVILFAAAASVVMLSRREEERKRTYPVDPVLRQTGRVILPAILMFGIYVIVNGHLSPGGGFSGGTVLGCGLILCSLVLGWERTDRLLAPRRLACCSSAALLLYGGLKGVSFFAGANGLGWELPRGRPGALLSGGLILPLNLCVGVIVACTMYTMYRTFSRRGEL